MLTFVPESGRAMTQRKGGTWLRTRYQYGEIVVKHGKAHDSYMGRWKEDLRLSNGQIFRRKRSRVFGIVGKITEKQAKRQLEGSSPALTTPDTSPNQPRRFRLLPKSGATKRFAR